MRLHGSSNPIAGRRILLLQGPLGPFFRRLAQDLELAGAIVHKINFNGGDWLFQPRGAINFAGSLLAWPAFLDALLADLRIDTVFMFGDCRKLHRIASEIARRRGIEVGVFEEGYVRPDYITLEQFGANGHSLLPREPQAYHHVRADTPERAHPVGNAFWHGALWAIAYYLAAALARPWFPHYQHHRPLTPLEGLPWVRGLARKALYRWRDRGQLKLLSERLTGKYFLVPLQVHNDSQVLAHSGFDSVESFLRDVVLSFSLNAPVEAHLVFKHHPMDRGYHDYRRLLADLGRKHGLGSRLHYVHDLHLPTLLSHARGVVVINSTVGLSALDHRVPVKVCGRAVYDIEGLVFRGTLAAFWKAAADFDVDGALFEKFRHYVILRTQVNGNFYRRLPGCGNRAGLRWRERRSSRATVNGISTGRYETVR